MRSLPERLHLGVLMAAALALAGCAHADPFTWSDELPAGELGTRPEAYQIETGDVLSVRVLNQDGMSARTRVREDGKISMPFLHDVEVAGLTPQVVAEQMQTRLKDFVTNPVVTVSLEEPRPISISVVGEVAHPGVYPLEAGAGVLNAIAAAGGLNEYASRSRVFVLRKGAVDVQRIRFRYDELLRATGKSALFSLRRGDVVVAE